MAKMKLIPLADRVVVTPVTEKKTLSGIIIPETAGKDRPERGTVVAVGKGRVGDDGKRIPLEVSVGDEVVFSKYGPEEIKVDGFDYYILREDQILAIIK
jgi:chaperonin GroES